MSTATYTKNDSITLQITDLTKNGEGIGKRDGFVFFVKDTVPGDHIRAQITKVKKTYGYARVTEILHGSPDRVAPPCPVARQCGGCQLQMMSLPAQLAYKEDLVENALQRIGGFSLQKSTGQKKHGLPDGDAPVLLPIVSVKPYLRYRNKAIIPVGQDREGNPVAGFYAGRTHSIIPCQDCLLGPEEISTCMQVILSWMKRHAIPAYDEKRGTGLIRHVFFRKSRLQGSVQICFILNGRGLPAAEDLRKRLQAIPDLSISGVFFSVNKKQTNVIFGEKPRLLWGETVLTDELRAKACAIAVRYYISPVSFFQVNPFVAEKMYAYVLELAQLTGTETVFDLYCGIGTISLFLAKKAGRVIGVEVIPEAVNNARENARLNKIDNVRFLAGKAEEIIPAMYQQEKIKADVVVVDPPRKGCDQALLDTITAMSPEKIIYVSCDPATMARDTKILSGNGYSLRSVRPFDQFVMTTHVETVVLLSKGEISTKNIRVEFPLEEMDMSGFQQGATYEEIKKYILEQHGLKAPSLFIAQIKRKCGLEMGENYNLPKDENARVPQCTPEKEAAIMDALRHFHMIG